MTVDLSEDLSSDATIVESGQLAFNHYFNYFLCGYQICMIKPDYDR